MKRFLIAGLAGASVFGAVFGFAAAIDVSSDNFGSGDQAVATCDAEVNASYTTSYNATDAVYEVTAVKVEGIDTLACAGHTVGVTLSNDSDANIGDGAATVSGATTSVAIDETPDAESVTGVHVVIRDGNSTSAED